jgi:hypothetical protein
MRLLGNLVFAVAVSACVLYAAYDVFGARGLAVGMPVLALLARPLVDIVGGFPRFAARLAMRRYAGRYFEFRGRSMDIHIDADARCWVSTADARKIVALPIDAVLSRLAPLDCRELGDPPKWRITTDGLTQALTGSTNPEVGKFCHWLEVDVARPARNRRDGRRVPG